MMADDIELFVNDAKTRGFNPSAPFDQKLIEHVFNSYSVSRVTWLVQKMYQEHVQEVHTLQSKISQKENENKELEELVKSQEVVISAYKNGETKFKSQKSSQQSIINKLKEEAKKKDAEIKNVRTAYDLARKANEHLIGVAKTNTDLVNRTAMMEQERGEVEYK